MFDWNEEDGVTDTIWGDFKEKEDHIVPYPKVGEDGAFMIGDYWNKHIDEEKWAGIRSEQSGSGSKNELPGCTLDPSHSLTEEEPSDSRFHMDSWSNFSSVDNAFGKGGSDGYGSVLSTMINDCKDAPDFGDARGTEFTELCQSGDILDDNASSFKETNGFPFDDRMELDSKTAVFSSEHEHKEADSFLDCDWGSIADFDDFDQFDGIFRNSGSIFGHETTRDVDELLSPTGSTNTAATFSMHDTSMDMPVEKQSCSFWESGESEGKRKGLKDDEMADHTVSEEQTGCLSQFTCGNNGIGDHNPDIIGRQKRIPKAQRKLVEKKKTKSQKSNIVGASNPNQVQQFERHAPVSAATQWFQASGFSQQGQIRAPNNVGYFPSSHQALAGYGYPAFPFPSIHLPPHIHPAKKQHQPVLANFNAYPQQHASRPSSLQNLPDATLRTPKMTPQEKIEKLRRRQQMQAMLAIKQQEKQFDKDVGTTDIALSQKIQQMNQSQGSVLSTIETTEDSAKGICPSEHSMPVEQEDSHVISISPDDNMLQEKILCEFQETIFKLDNNLRLCMKESLFRLARSAVERRNASDTSSANINTKNVDGIFTNETRSLKNRPSAIPDVETVTNPIDRIVAHLLFYSPQASFTRPAKEVTSSVPGNLGSKLSNTWECATDDKIENVEMKGNAAL